MTTDEIVNAGTGRKLTAEESEFKTRNWPKVGDPKPEFKQDSRNNIPCGYDDEGNITSTCYCK